MRRVFIFHVRAPVYPTQLRLADVHGERGGDASSNKTGEC